MIHLCKCLICASYFCVRFTVPKRRMHLYVNFYLLISQSVFWFFVFIVDSMILTLVAVASSLNRRHHHHRSRRQRRRLRFFFVLFAEWNTLVIVLLQSEAFVCLHIVCYGILYCAYTFIVCTLASTQLAPFVGDGKKETCTTKQN